MTIIDMATRRCRGAYRYEMNHTVPLPEHVPELLASDVLGLPVELLRWISLVGPHIAKMGDIDRMRVLAEMGAIAGGSPTAAVNVAVADNVVQVTTTEGGDVNQS